MNGHLWHTLKYWESWEYAKKAALCILQFSFKYFEAFFRSGLATGVGGGSASAPQNF